MCGIAGFVGGFLPGLMESMNALQAHRGPDGRGAFENPAGPVALGHVRLAILDLSAAAAQPMSAHAGRFTIVYNGEIYNFRELRRDLEARGERFVSTGDTEVLLKGLALEGERFLGKLNGIFAFAIWDARERELWLARDPLGVKPLYLAEPQPGALLFASEIKALLAHPGIPREPDWEGLLHHLSFGHASGPQTALAAVRRLPPGALLRWKAGKAETTRYWRPPFGRGFPHPRGEARDLLRRRLAEAAARQLVSDVPVGAFFSGGLDSTLVAALAGRQKKDGSFTCFTIAYPSSENVLDRAVEDGPFARRASLALGLRYEEQELKPDVVTLWPRLVYHLDEPLADPAAIACYLVSRLARERGTPVLLSGQGADELFGGYPRYPAMWLTGWADRVSPTLARVAASTAAILPGALPGPVGAWSRRLRRLLAASDRPRDERFLSYCASTPEADIRGVLGEAFLAGVRGRSAFDRCLERMREEGLAGPDRWLERDLSVYLPNHNLLYTDKMSMAVGLEARVPLLDLDLVSDAVRYPLEWKVRRRLTKVLLREAAAGTVPDEIVQRPKAGFGAPYRKWLRHDLGEMWGDLTSPSVVNRRGWFSAEGLRRIREESQSGKSDLYMLQWAVLTMELWARHFLDGRAAGPGANAPGIAQPAHR